MESNTENNLKFLTWNILAQKYVNYNFPHLLSIPDEEKIKFLSWEQRISTIKNRILNFNADVILLQEVTLSEFENDFNFLFDNYDYVIHVQSKSKKGRNNFMGNVILWMKTKLSLVESFSRTKAIHAKLNWCDSNLCVSNVHFTGGLYTNGSIRAKEMRSCLSVWKNEANDYIIVIGGDFNDNFQDETEEGLKHLLNTNNINIVQKTDLRV